MPFLGYALIYTLVSKKLVPYKQCFLSKQQQVNQVFSMPIRAPMLQEGTQRESVAFCSSAHILPVRRDVEEAKGADSPCKFLPSTHNCRNKDQRPYVYNRVE